MHVCNVSHTLKGLNGKGVAHALAVQVMTVELASFAVISLNLVDLEERKKCCERRRCLNLSIDEVRSSSY